MTSTRVMRADEKEREREREKKGEGKLLRAVRRNGDTRSEQRP
jgi:muconolactone delta-isomerase